MPVRHANRVLLFALSAFCAAAFAVTAGSGASHPHVQAVQQLLSIPEPDVDFAAAKVTIDRLIDPHIDAEVTLRRIDEIAAEIRALVTFRSTTQQRAAALRSYLYDAGPWNKGQTFSYDFNDPLGRHLPNKLLANYLRTRKGNCVSMPFLYIALAQKLGLTVGAASSPRHVFVKLRDDHGTWHNIETVSGGWPRRDSLYHQDAAMTPESIASGIYMRPLGKRETVALMAAELFQHHGDPGSARPDVVIALADVLLQHDPINLDAMLSKGRAYYLIGKDRCVDTSMSSRKTNERERQECIALQRENIRWYEKAEKLGWREPPPEEEAKYLNMVKGVAESQNQAR